MIGARRTRDASKETARLDEELQALRLENAKLRDRDAKWVARDRKTKAMQAKVVDRLKQIMGQNAMSATASAFDVAEAQREVTRSLQMTLSIFHQYRDYCVERETESLILRRKYDLALEQLDYFVARNQQMEVLAKTLLVYAKEQGLLHEGSALSQQVKAVRESNPLPSRREEEWEQRAQAADVVTEDQLPLKCVSLQERVREFEHFLELKRLQTPSPINPVHPVKKEEGQPPPSQSESLNTPAAAAAVETVVAAGAAPSSIPSSPPPVLRVPSNREMNLPLGSKAAQRLGLDGSGDGPRLSFGGRGSPAPAHHSTSAPPDGVLAKRVPISLLPFMEWPTVLHVQQVVSLLGASKPRLSAPSQQVDPIREEANKARPNVEWIIQELTPLLVTTLHHSGSKGKLGRIGSRVHRGGGLDSHYKLDPEWRTDTGLSLLHVLVTHDDAAKLLEELMKRHSFTGSEHDSSGVSAFMYACMYSLPCVHRFLKVNPRLVNEVCREDLTPLHVAALYGNAAICKLLLEHNAHLELDRHGASPAVYALLNDQLDTLSFFVNKVSGACSIGDTMGNTPLLMACCMSSKEVVAELIRAGAKPGVPNAMGLSPLWMALQLDNTHLVNVLLSAPGIDLDHPYGPYKWTLVMMCIVFLPESKSAAAVKMLLAKGASPHAVNAEKKTAMFHAVIFDRQECLRVLVDAGADCNAKDAFDNRPLHFAQSVDVTTFLIVSGAKINVKNRAGNTALHNAFMFQNSEVATLLIEKGSSEATLNDTGETPNSMSKYSAQIAIPFFALDASNPSTGGIILTKRQ